MALDACSIGIFCKDSNSCHKTSFTRKVGLDLIQNLTYEEKECLLWRSNVQRMNASQDTTLTVCYHHKMAFLAQFTCKQMSCCNLLEFILDFLKQRVLQ